MPRLFLITITALNAVSAGCLLYLVLAAPSPVRGPIAVYPAGSSAFPVSFEKPPEIRLQEPVRVTGELKTREQGMVQVVGPIEVTGIVELGPRSLRRAP